THAAITVHFAFRFCRHCLLIFYYLVCGVLLRLFFDIVAKSTTIPRFFTPLESFRHLKPLSI
ncbi:unnamed protein product, partial [Callosobruchus maculatus]